MSDSSISPIVLVCVLCGAQRELPVLADMTGPWLHCVSPCKGMKFLVRLRVPTVKTEPHP